MCYSMFLKKKLVLIFNESFLDYWWLTWNSILESFSWFLNCSWLNLEIILLVFLSSSLLSSKHLESILIHYHEAMKFASTEEMSLMLRFLFSRRYPKPVPVKLRSHTCQRWECETTKPVEEIWTPPSKSIFSHSHRWDLQTNVFAVINLSWMLTVKWRLQSLPFFSNAWKP